MELERLQTLPGQNETIYVTLGPEGTNHDFVLRNRLKAQESKSQIVYGSTAEDMLEMCVQGAATHIMICAAHPSAAHIVATAQYSHGILLSDTFIASSEPLAILSLRDNPHPRTIAMHPATRNYTSLEDFEDVVEVTSTVRAFEGLLRREWDCALTQHRFADRKDLKVLRPVQAARDAWLVLSRH